MLECPGSYSDRLKLALISCGIEQTSDRVKFASVDGKTLHTILQTVRGVLDVIVLYSLTLMAYRDSETYVLIMFESRGSREREFHSNPAVVWFRLTVLPGFEPSSVAALEK